MITTSKLDKNTFNVTVSKDTTTAHQVQLSDAYHKQLTNDTITKETLIEAAFAFLLERESNTSILSQFRLQKIQSYFPEFEKNMKSQFLS